jgi:hypothetical protein
MADFIQFERHQTEFIPASHLDGFVQSPWMRRSTPAEIKVKGLRRK